jgi:hypothetical protein
MRKSLVFGAALALLAPAPLAAAEIGGRYSVDGTNFNGSHYGGTAEISLGSNTACRIVWHIDNVDWNGVCMRVGETLVGAYKYRDLFGVVYYELKSDGKLDGVWNAADQDGVGKEVLTPSN